jgi:hypothetical protein
MNALDYRQQGFKQSNVINNKTIQKMIMHLESKAVLKALWS